MAKAKNTSKKKIVRKAPAKKKVKIVIKKPDLSKIKNWNWKPVTKILGLVIIIISVFTLIDLGVQYLNNDFSVAVVDGLRISKSQWHKRLESSYGSTIAQQLIDEAVIQKEAKKADVTVSKEEVQGELDTIISSIGGQEAYDSALIANNITEEELKDQIELDLLITKILTPTLEYTDDDVKEFFNQYSDVIFPDETEALEDGEKLDYDELKERTLEVYIQQQVQSQKSSWLTEKEAEYKIQDNSTNKPAYGFLTTTRNIINNLLNSSKEE